MSISKIFLIIFFFLLPSLKLYGRTTTSPWRYEVKFFSHWGTSWFNESGKREKMDVRLTIRGVSFVLNLPIYKKLHLEYSLSYLETKGVSTFYLIKDNTIIPARTLQQKNSAMGDSEISAILERRKGKSYISISLPTGNSDFYPGKYPTGSGRWSVAIGDSEEISIFIPLRIKGELRYLFPHTYSYIDYLWNIMYYKAPGKTKLFLNIEGPFHISNTFNFIPVAKYYHEVALSKENMLWGGAKLEFRSSTLNIISIQAIFPVYGKYYPSQPLPYFFWEDQLPLGYTLTICWRGTW